MYMLPGHALLWLLPVQRIRTKREVAHASNTFNVPMPVGGSSSLGVGRGVNNPSP
jgi:hypothetical protein